MRAPTGITNKDQGFEFQLTMIYYDAKISCRGGFFRRTEAYAFRRRGPFLYALPTDDPRKCSMASLAARRAGPHRDLFVVCRLFDAKLCEHLRHLKRVADAAEVSFTRAALLMNELVVP